MNALELIHWASLRELTVIIDSVPPETQVSKVTVMSIRSQRKVMFEINHKEAAECQYDMIEGGLNEAHQMLKQPIKPV